MTQLYWFYLNWMVLVNYDSCGLLVFWLRFELTCNYKVPSFAAVGRDCYKTLATS